MAKGPTPVEMSEFGAINSSMYHGLTEFAQMVALLHLPQFVAHAHVV